MSTTRETIKWNLERLISMDGRSLTDIAVEAFPDKTPNAARLMLGRAIKHGWMQVEVVESLQEVFGVQLAEFYLPIDSKLGVVDLRRKRLKEARAAVREAGKAFTRTLKETLSELAKAARESVSEE